MKLCMPSHVSMERERILKAYGVVVMIFPDSGNMYLSERLWDEGQ